MTAFVGRMGLVLLLALASSPAEAGSAVFSESLKVPRVDGTLVDVHLQRPSTKRKVPLLVYIDGSLCIPSTYNESVAWLLQKSDGAHPFALAVIEKPGPTLPALNAEGDIEIGPDFQCSAEFRQHYSIDQRVIDHLRVLQHLNRHASWWNGELLVWGFSDGGRIGAQLAAYYPQTKAVALVGVGGGMRMADSMEAMVCAAPADAAACRESLRKEMDEIRAAPVPTRDWMGESNTYATWASRLDAVEANVLRDLKAPLLVVHGERDGSVPVASARKLAELMQGSGVVFRYREVPGMRHSLWGAASPQQGEALHQEVLEWLTAQEEDVGR
ncbi:prolyl oligopeptidase family serine peptidase [Stenotrophomonas sp. PS02300]|uniref:alpha/beta hydrolase family protein n=1 Tax=Stenotrophomonas sp. PS02300 TaxID=2991426 RepID=UPI00249B917F|nr:prolyl oligopeptidase family serine peptidase [Stenotrophomonas sp. PS02300]